ncbi:MAG: PEP-utilizing enzyme [Candidatus Micrarchaeota archaeon]
MKLEFVLEEDKASHVLWLMHVYAFCRPSISALSGVPLERSLIKIEKGYGKWAVDPKNWREISSSVLHRLKTGEIDPQKIVQESKRYGAEAVTISDSVIAAELHAKSDPELKQLFSELYEALSGITALGFLPVVIDFHNFALSTELTKVLERRIEGQGLDKEIKPPEALSVLAASHYYTQAKQENIELFELTAAVERELGKNFADEKALQQAVDASPPLKKRLEKHAEKWKWIEHGYVGPAYSKQDFLKELLRAIRQYNAQNEEKRLKEADTVLRLEQAALEKKLGLSEEDAALFNAARDFMYAKAYRMDVRNKAYYAFGLLLEEAARRTGYSKEELHATDFHELLALLDKSGSPTREELARRLELCAWVQEGSSITPFTGERAEAELESRIAKQEHEDVTELRGQVACVGRATGKAKIVKTAADVAKVQHGDILVSPMTNPNLVPAMAKAAAFVTETGGITCHAAIVAREMSKPCVIGTKIATKAFKDGDLVEVDAVEGTVRKISG